MGLTPLIPPWSVQTENQSSGLVLWFLEKPGAKSFKVL